MDGCLFCEFARGARAVLAENRSFVAVYDKFPVSRGHTLVVPKRHIESFFDLYDSEVLDAFALIKQVRKLLDEEIRPDGYNIGLNNGTAAGQTVPHMHIHIIPRRKGDVANPQGGVRNIIPNLVPYRTSLPPFSAVEVR